MYRNNSLLDQFQKYLSWHSLAVPRQAQPDQTPLRCTWSGHGRTWTSRRTEQLPNRYLKGPLSPPRTFPESQMGHLPKLTSWRNCSSPYRLLATMVLLLPTPVVSLRLQLPLCLLLLFYTRSHSNLALLSNQNRSDGARPLGPARHY